MSNDVVAIFVSNRDQKPLLANQLEARGLTVLRAQSSDQLCSYINGDRIDAVVVEQHAGGFLTGLEILERIRAQLLRPILVILGSLNEREKSTAADLRIDYVCSWDAGFDNICTSILGLLGLARHGRLSIPAAARQLVAESKHIGVMPQLVVQLTKYLTEEDASVRQLARDLSSDPRVTAELMKLVNSAAFGLRTNITDVETVVKYLGIRRTVSLVLELSFHAVRHACHQRVSFETMNWFGLRSVVNACVASAFASRWKDVSPDAVYILALLQDIGILVLCQAYQQRYVHLLSRVQTIGQIQLELIEKSEFSFTHADVSAALLQQWEFPSSMIQLVLEHHSAPDNLSELDQKFLHLMKLGESVANLRDVPSPQRQLRLEKCLSQSSANSPVDIKSCIAAAIQQSREATSYFHLAVPETDNWWSLIQKIEQGFGKPLAEPTSQIPLQSSNGPPIVMVIDDEPAIGKMFKFFLSDMPLRIDFREVPPPLNQVSSEVVAIVCDVHLNQYNGVDFVREVRASGFTKPIMMISGDRTRDTVINSIEAGIVDYIVKPITKESILEKFQKHGLLKQTASDPTAVGLNVIR